ncbi:MAG TPA: hypothetical protein VN285_04195 [Candidatus Deferrimicrobium sp.]|nr:hypothetical protein [Candidatus Deferrimicrobium sp.]
MIERFRQRAGFAILLQLLLPGLGHLYWREYLFGVFVFLVTLLASVLFVVSFLFPLSWIVKLIMYTLPLLFYAFTFYDLLRSVRRRRSTGHLPLRFPVILLLGSVVYQLLSPIAPVNFGWQNRPIAFEQKDGSLSPLYSRGELLLVNRLSYSINLSLLNRPLLHSLPERYEVVAYLDSAGRQDVGLIVGLPGESVQIVDGVVVVDDLPDFGDAPGGIVLAGDAPLTTVGGYSVLVAELNLGRVIEVHEVSLAALRGRVRVLS